MNSLSGKSRPMSQPMPVLPSAPPLLVREETSSGGVKRSLTPIDIPRKPNAWMVHVAAFRAAHKDMKYKEILREAKKTYTKVEPKKKQIENKEIS